MKITNIILIIAVVVAIVFSSCRKGCTDPMAENYDARAKKENNTCIYDSSSSGNDSTQIKLVFNHLSGTSTFAFNTTYQDDFGNDYQFLRAEMYVANPIFRDHDGNILADPESYALIDPSKTSVNICKLKTEDHIHTMDICMGVDSKSNNLDPAVLSADFPDLGYQSPSLHWGWNTGYIFMALEGIVDEDGNGSFDAGENFTFHIGTNQTYTTLTGLMVHFHPVGGMTHNIELDLDWSKFFTGVDLSVDNGTHTMDNVPLATSIANNFTNALTLH